MVSVPLPDVLWGRTLRRLESVLLHVGVHETARRNARSAHTATGGLPSAASRG